MLSSALVREIEQLLQEGRLSQRQISFRLNVSRGSIAAVARGAWKGFGRDEDELPDEAIPAVRCRGCGGMVRPPCRLCAIRALKAAERLRRDRVRCFLATCGATACGSSACGSSACGSSACGTGACGTGAAAPATCAATACTPANLAPPPCHAPRSCRPAP